MSVGQVSCALHHLRIVGQRGILRVASFAHSLQQPFQTLSSCILAQRLFADGDPGSHLPLRIYTSHCTFYCLGEITSLKQVLYILRCIRGQERPIIFSTSEGTLSGPGDLPLFIKPAADFSFFSLKNGTSSVATGRSSSRIYWVGWKEYIHSGTHVRGASTMGLSPVPPSLRMTTL